MLHHAFAHPRILALLAVLPALGLLAVWSRRRRRQALARLGNAATLDALPAPRSWLRALRRLCLLLGLTGLALGAAGPQWGRDWQQTAAPGRDLVVVLDCSRSMFAEAPSRLERAKAALVDLSRGVERRGGHRLALVVFAGRARLACPLTHDYDHFRETLDAVDTAAPDPDLEPGPGVASGTRIGRGLAQAVLAHDPRFQGCRDILLVSDGDDPARDGEWRQGAAEARAQGIPVHAVGVGDPDRGHRIPAGEGWLHHDGREVLTRLQDVPLREIAETTHGVAEFARTSTLPLGDLYLDLMAAQPVREENDDTLPVYQQRYALSFGPALGFLCLSMLIPERRRRARPPLAGLLAPPLSPAEGGPP